MTLWEFLCQGDWLHNNAIMAADVAVMDDGTAICECLTMDGQILAWEGEVSSDTLRSVRMNLRFVRFI